ncbi:uncharacterized protein BJX67DRAFT_109419 [Aspergillus lucknowensis]|uniref:GPI anchored protein n=1 Tax=Aspergillus lucknowensis TaxID=176173 RepID=A0ABR4LUC0_9EURO
MAYKLLTLLAMYLLVATVFANENVEVPDAVFDGFDLGDHFDYNVNEVHALVDHIFVPRSALATVTVTETICGPTSPTVVTDTFESSPAPTTGQPPMTTDTSGVPSDQPPSPTSPTSLTSSEVSTSATDGPTTSFQTNMSSSKGDNESPTETSDSPTDTIAPPTNAGFTQEGMDSVFLALALTILQLVGV